MLNPAGLLNHECSTDTSKAGVPFTLRTQSVACGMVMDFNIEPDGFVQIIHNGRGHWLTISTIALFV